MSEIAAAAAPVVQIPDPKSRVARCCCGSFQVTCVGEPVRCAMCHCLSCQVLHFFYVLYHNIHLWVYVISLLLFKSNELARLLESRHDLMHLKLVVVDPAQHSPVAAIVVD